MSIIYNIILYSLLLPAKFFYSIFNKKFKEREIVAKSSYKTLSALPNCEAKRIWFHAASMGEFEQAKPVIELIKKMKPDYQIICSFFSPSGYLTQRNYPFADAVVYLPFDTKRNACQFLDAMQPDISVFVRYDAWWNYLSRLEKLNIPAILINATRPSDKFWKKTFVAQLYYKKIYSKFSDIFTVDSRQTNYFENLKLKYRIHTSSDTRFDRILEKVRAAESQKVIPQEIVSDEFVLVAGSIWQTDFEVISEAVRNINRDNKVKITVVYVPHEPEAAFLEYIEARLAESIRLSQLLERLEKNETVRLPSGGAIVVDSIGKLLKLYGNADFAFVGGGFGVGVHSLTEPAGYGVPLFCGSNCFNSPDAAGLLAEHALIITADTKEFETNLVELLNDIALRAKRGSQANEYVTSRSGSAQKIANFLLGFGH